MTEDSEQDKQRESILKRLSIQTGLPLIPTNAIQIERDFDNDSIIMDYYPIKSICELKIDNDNICMDRCLIDKDYGIIFLPKQYTGTLCIKYIYQIPEDDYSALIDLIIEYENDPAWDKRASSITEGGVTVSIDTSVGKGALIQSMINDLKNKYNSTARLI